MKRIGLVASKMAKGNLAVYNITVIIIAGAISFLLFFLSGFSILLALLLMGFVSNGFESVGLNAQWLNILKVCLGALAIVIGILNVTALIKNIKWRIKK